MYVPQESRHHTVLLAAVSTEYFCSGPRVGSSCVVFTIY